jgi:predicted nucleotidyltransferase
MTRNTAIRALRRLVSTRAPGTIYLFGSAINSLSGDSDIDLILIASKRRLINDLDFLRRAVKRSLRRRLHIQLFHSSDVGGILKFFRRCGPRYRLK